MTKNKTQKKRVQRGGEITNAKLHANLRDNIIRYINSNYDDPEVRKKQLEDILNKKAEIEKV